MVNWALWRPVGGLLLLLGVVMRTGPAFADDQREGYSATVRVDATADSVAAARELARVEGQRRALVLVIDRLSGSTDSAKLSKVDDKTVTDMVESFEVANERMSAVRYLADYTFHFRASKVRRLVHTADGAPAEAKNSPAVVEDSSKPLVVLPVYKDAARTVLWDDPNAWREAWGQRSADTGLLRLTVPLGDANDLAIIDAGRAEAGKPDALTAIAQRNGSDEAIVALATARREGDKLVGLDLNIKRYRSGRLLDTHGTTLDADPGETADDFLKRAADAVAGEIASSSKKSPGTRSDQQASLAASVPIGSIGEWVRVRDRLASVVAIRKVDLLSLNRHEAKIQIKYVGSFDQLRSSLAEVDLGLDGTDPIWRLQLSGATGAR
ncbi:MAG: DUF2066 domain-containing protein [Alphaproteobacteria bacterium]|nr:DUF2066 domain-containing protein [Alphaproteobacteria bacterium]